MDIPYGRSNFEDIRRRGSFYVDKTVFLPLLEEGITGFPLFLRPRRFGKSTLLSMLEHYYDLAKKDQFDALFKGLWAHEHPTPEKNSYLVMKLDFSSVATDSGPEALRRTFLDTIKNSIEDVLLAYGGEVPSLRRLEEKLSLQEPESIMGALFSLVRRSGHKLYLLIDEYDHFANRLLSMGEQEAYLAAVKGTGFVRTFYAALKAGTQTGALGRIFITGVSPLMLDDLSSGFNIATNISMSPRFNTLAGFTRAETERAVDTLLASRPTLGAIHDRAALFDVLEKHYNGYRFSPQVDERVFNSAIVLYFLQIIADTGAYPETMLDINVRTEYRHLQRIGPATGAGAPDHRALLQTVLTEGHVRCELLPRFGLQSLASREPFLSLLYHLGMLTLGPAPRDAYGYDLEIPNRVIRELQWEHLAALLHDDAGVTLRLDDLRFALSAMAADGDIQPLLDLFHTHVLKALSNRDTRNLDEKTLKLLLMTYASLGRAFYPLSEKEFAQGYSDLFLGPTPNVHGARYSWLLELKYLKANSKPAQIEAAFEQAEAQVERYANDTSLLPILLGERSLKAGMLVFVGTQKILFRAWPKPTKPPTPPKATSKPPKTAKRARKAKPSRGGRGE